MTFPRLEVIEALKESFQTEINFNSIVLISVQHLVETTGSLFEYLLELGFLPQNIYLKGKVYSTNKVVEDKLRGIGIRIYPSSLPTRFGVLREAHKKEINQLWVDVEANLKTDNILIILDDGGLTIRFTPASVLTKHKVYAIEQTTYGLRFQTERPTIPIIQVATSAAKTLLEPLMISRALHRKLQIVLKDMKPKTVGVVGFGHIGQGVAGFLSKTYRVFVYDKDANVKVPANDRIVQLNSIEELVRNSEVVVGATGVDISDIEWSANVVGHKLLLSVSSHDTEFNTLIRTQNTPEKSIKNVLADLPIYFKKGAEAVVFRGGSVANFDNTKESCKKNEIQLTRGLLFAGILQVLGMLRAPTKPEGHFKLCSDYQKLAVDTWFGNSPHYKAFYPSECVNNFKNTQWIEANS